MSEREASTHQHRARKRFGQNFLHDQSLIAKIVRSINPMPDDHMVEIGPGLGALTKPLLAKLDRLQVIELDRDLIPGLRIMASDPEQLTVHESDALAFDFQALQENSGKPLRVVGNLPYNISTPLMFHLFHSGAAIADMHFMLQKEVVDRLCAPPGNKQYGRLSVVTAYHAKAHFLFKVGPGAFRPQPKVDSAIVRLVPHAKPPVALDSYESFETVLQTAFSQRRKTLRRIFKGQLNEADFGALQLDPQQRPENLTLEQFAELSNRLNSQTTNST